MKRYAWLMVAIGGLMGCVAVGAMFSLAVFLKPITQSTGWSTAAVSSAMTLNFLAMGLGGFLWGALNDRFGTRPVVLAGSVLLGAGLVLASRASSQLEFQLAYGVLVGLATGSFFAPMIANVSSWFGRNRALAVSLVSAGVGVAPMTISPFAAWLLSHGDWRAAQMTIGVLSWGLLVPASLAVRPAPAMPVDGPAPDDKAMSQAPSMTVGEAVRSLPFVVLAATFFACCATHSGPIFHTVSYAMSCGLPTMAAVTIYSVEGLAGLGGRVAFGMAADRYGVKAVLVGGLLLQAFAAGAYVFAVKLQDFYAVATAFGFAYGGVMPLYAVLVRGYFGPKIMGTIFGAAAMVSSLGMALGPLIGGWIFDRFHGYAPLYIGSFAFGLGAAAIALAFPPFGRPAALQAT